MKEDKSKTGIRSFSVKRVAWNGISFSIPDNWEISSYRFPSKNRTCIEVEDEYALRLEAEWAVESVERLKRVRKRYRDTVGDMAKEADSSEEITSLPAGWTASRYEFRQTETAPGKGSIDVETHALATALYDDPNAGLFAYFIFRFHPKDTEDPSATVRLIAESFKNHTADAVRPWALFDIDIELPAEFTVDKTLFDVGAKMLCFNQGKRRLRLWFFSCADVILKEAESLEHWVTGYLNAWSGIKGKRFYPEKKGVIHWRRKFPHLITFRDDLFRWCFKTKISCRLNKDKNRIEAAMYNFRKETDLEMLPSWVKFGD